MVDFKLHYDQISYELYSMIGSRVSAKTGEGKVILSHTTGEPFFFTFGKSEVMILIHSWIFSFLFLIILFYIFLFVWRA